MNSGYEALPQRERGKHRVNKRRRLEEDSPEGDDAGTSSGAGANPSGDAGAASGSNSGSSSGSSAAGSAHGTRRDREDDKAAADDYDDDDSSGDLTYTPHCTEEFYEFLDHTADVQIHGWSDTTLEDALAQTALGMYGYMTDPDSLVIDPACSRFIRAEGHDMVSLLYNFLDQCVYSFATDDFVAKDIKVVELHMPPPGSTTSSTSSSTSNSNSSKAGEKAKYRIKAAFWGEKFRFGHHPQGTEIKAITYSNMQIYTPEETYSANIEVPNNATVETDEAATSSSSSTATSTAGAEVEAEVEGHKETTQVKSNRRGKYDVFVIVDI